MKSEIQLKRIQLALKILSPDKSDTIVQDVLNYAMDNGTEWTDEVNENIGDLYGRGIWLRPLSQRNTLDLSDKWIRRDHTKQWNRLETQVMKTTGLYRELNPQGVMIDTASYITTNYR